MFSSTDKSRHGRSEETSLRVTCEWPYVPANDNGIKVPGMLILIWLTETRIFVTYIKIIHDIRIVTCDLLWAFWAFFRSLTSLHISKEKKVRDLIVITLLYYPSLIYIYIDSCNMISITSYSCHFHLPHCEVFDTNFYVNA